MMMDDDDDEDDADDDGDDHHDDADDDDEEDGDDGANAARTDSLYYRTAMHVLDASVNSDARFVMTCKSAASTAERIGGGAERSRSDAAAGEKETKR